MGLSLLSAAGAGAEAGTSTEAQPFAVPIPLNDRLAVVDGDNGKLGGDGDNGETGEGSVTDASVRCLLLLLPPPLLQLLIFRIFWPILEANDTLRVCCLSCLSDVSNKHATWGKSSMVGKVETQSQRVL